MQKDVEQVHQDADLKATGLEGKPLKEGFRNHGIMPLVDALGSRGGATHSIGIRPHPKGIATSLLAATSAKQVLVFDETRPLIDLVQQATFTDIPSMQYVTDKHAFRTLLRKAHCFRLDAETSAMVADFSVAIAQDLEATRHLAIPPFPVTWFEIDNIARLKRVKEWGVKLTRSAASEDVCPRVGWLIHPANDLAGSNGFYATYCTLLSGGPVVAPLSYFWHPESPYPGARDWGSLVEDEISMLAFGLHDSGVLTPDAFPCACPFQYEYRAGRPYSGPVRELMRELSGELRHIWGLLLALGAGQIGTQTTHTPQPLAEGPHPVAKGKPVLPLEHKVLTIKLAKRMTVEKVTARAITGVKHRWHEVRGHFRTKLNADGSVKWRIPIKAHSRGDERLGKITKDYKVER